MPGTPDPISPEDIETLAQIEEATNFSYDASGASAGRGRPAD